MASYEPKENREYKTQEYWETRFETEGEYEWLVKFEVVAPLLAQFVAKPGLKILIVGCGNSNFSFDLWNGTKEEIRPSLQLTSIDFSENVIVKMRERFQQYSGNLDWEVMDMTAMTFPEGSFDIVIDKAAMDALVTNEGDPWNPNEETRAMTSKMMDSVAHVLKRGGKFIQISFQQPHFRKRYLSTCPDKLTEPTVESIDHGMGYFFFTQERQ